MMHALWVCARVMKQFPTVSGGQSSMTNTTSIQDTLDAPPGSTCAAGLDVNYDDHIHIPSCSP